MASIYTYQPGKTIYTILFTLRVLLHVPWLIILFLFPSQRPDRHWTYRQALGRTVVYYASQYAAIIELKPFTSLVPGQEKDRFVIIEPLEKQWYCDVLRCDGAIQPAKIGAVWYPDSPAPRSSPGSRLFLHFHGGAYILGGGRNADVGYATSLLVQNSPGCKVFCPEYRLASSTGGRFPAALQDAVTAYAYLVRKLGIPPSDVILSGDSAGANLALALLRFIHDHPNILPTPAAILLWSPWTNMTGTVEDAAQRPAAKIDHVVPELISWAYRDFLPGVDTKISRENPYLSANKGASLAFIPMWVQWGSNEVLVEEVEEFVHLQENVAQGRNNKLLRTHVTPYAPHDIFALPSFLGWKREATIAVQEAMRFLEETIPRKKSE